MMWWEADQELLQAEIDQLAAAGMYPEVVEHDKSEGLLKISITINILGTQRTGFIQYPDLYPYFRPFLIVPDLGFDLRHYNPATGEVCLLKRGTMHWKPDMTAAFLIAEMLHNWEAAAIRKFEDSRLDREDRQAEPFSVYFHNDKFSSLAIIDTSWEIPMSLESGRMKVAIDGQISKDSRFNAWILELQSRDKNRIGDCVANDALVSWVHNSRPKIIDGYWLRLNNPPQAKNTAELIAYLSREHQFFWDKIKNHNFGLLGLCFPEEAPSGTKTDGWLFIASCLDKTNIRKPNIFHWVIKTERAGKQDMFQRIPELGALQNKTIAVIGLGCVGAPSVLAFARAGAKELRLLDSDFVSPGTICRWPIGLSVTGNGKVASLCKYINDNYPYTKIGKNHYLGNSDDFRLSLGQNSKRMNEREVLLKFISGVDLVYDATAEEGINQMMCDFSKSHGIPYIAVSSRPGGWGGNVVRVRPYSEGCYVCYLHALSDLTIVPPPYDQDGDDLQPTGCGDITFKASSFDVEEISMAGVRVAVATLCEGDSFSYPSIQSDIGILSLRKDGYSIFPEWKSYKLNKHKDCYCSK